MKQELIYNKYCTRTCTVVKQHKRILWTLNTENVQNVDLRSLIQNFKRTALGAAVQ